MAKATKTTPQTIADTPVVDTTPVDPAAPKGKLGLVIAMLRRPQGASIDDLAAATGWQVHSVRGALSGAIKKKLGLAVVSDKTEVGRVYRIVPGETA